MSGEQRLDNVTSLEGLFLSRDFGRDTSQPSNEGSEVAVPQDPSSSMAAVAATVHHSTTHRRRHSAAAFVMAAAAAVFVAVGLMGQSGPNSSGPPSVSALGSSGRSLPLAPGDRTLKAGSV